MIFLSVLRPISLTLMGLLLYMQLMDFKYDKRKTQAFMAATVCFIALTAALVISVFGQTVFTRLFVLLVNLPAMIGSFLTSKYNPGRVMFTLLVVWYLALLVLVPASAVFIFTEAGFALEMLCRLIVFIPVYLLVRHKIAPIYKHVLRKLDSGWWLYSLLPLVAIVVTQANAVDPSQPSSASFLRAFLTVLLMTLLYISYYALFKRLDKIYAQEGLAQSIGLQLRLQQERFALLQKKVEAVRRFDHDLRHYLWALSQFIRNGQQEEALAYIGNIHDTMERRQGEAIARYCENQMVDVLLSYYLEAVQEKGIEVTTDIALPAKCFIDEVELGVLLANALENAVIACTQAATAGEKAFLNVLCRQDAGRMRIEISNSTGTAPAFDAEGFPLSSRAGGGIGTRSIAATVQEHQGLCAFDVLEGSFRLRILIPVPAG